MYIASGILDQHCHFCINFYILSHLYCIAYILIWQLSVISIVFVDIVVSFRFCQNQVFFFFCGYYANEAVSSLRILESCQSKLVINTSPAPAVTSYWGVCQTRMYLGNRRKLSRHGLVDHSLTTAQHCGLILHIFKGDTGGHFKGGWGLALLQG